MNSAVTLGLKIYLCLLDTWSLYGKPSPDLVNSNKTDQYLALQNSWKKIIKNLLKDPVSFNTFVSNALVPLISLVGTHPSLFAIDLMNEPEGITTNDNSITISDVINYISVCADAIHAYQPTVKVSCGFSQRQTVLSNATRLADHLDFFDIHVYNDSGDLDLYQLSDFAQKQCIIGECGYPVGKTQYDSTRELPVLQTFLNNANLQGYAGCLAWLEDYTNKSAILNSVKDFADTMPIIQISTKKEGLFYCNSNIGF